MIFASLRLTLGLVQVGPEGAVVGAAQWIPPTLVTLLRGRSTVGPCPQEGGYTTVRALIESASMVMTLKDGHMKSPVGRSPP